MRHVSLFFQQLRKQATPTSHPAISPIFIVDVRLWLQFLLLAGSVTDIEFLRMSTSFGLYDFQTTTYGYDHPQWWRPTSQSLSASRESISTSLCFRIVFMSFCGCSIMLVLDSSLRLMVPLPSKLVKCRSCMVGDTRSPPLSRDRGGLPP